MPLSHFSQNQSSRQIKFVWEFFHYLLMLWNIFSQPLLCRSVQLSVRSADFKKGRECFVWLPNGVSNPPSISLYFCILSLYFHPQSPSAIWVQVVHPSGRLDLPDPGRVRHQPQHPSPARAWDWGDEDQDFRLKEWNTEREGNPALKFSYTVQCYSTVFPI